MILKYFQVNCLFSSLSLSDKIIQINLSESVLYKIKYPYTYKENN